MLPNPAPILLDQPAEPAGSQPAFATTHIDPELPRSRIPVSPALRAISRRGGPGRLKARGPITGNVELPIRRRSFRTPATPRCPDPECRKRGSGAASTKSPRKMRPRFRHQVGQSPPSRRATGPSVRLGVVRACGNRQVQTPSTANKPRRDIADICRAPAQWGNLTQRPRLALSLDQSANLIQRHAAFVKRRSPQHSPEFDFFSSKHPSLVLVHAAAKNNHRLKFYVCHAVRDQLLCHSSAGPQLFDRDARLRAAFFQFQRRHQIPAAADKQKVTTRILTSRRRRMIHVNQKKRLHASRDRNSALALAQA